MTDKWSAWLLSRRDGDDDRLRAQNAPSLAAFRDGVLDRAGLQPDDVLLDVGCGTGLIGFGALERLGPAGRVIFSDVSETLLAHCRDVAAGDERCTFVRAAAHDLESVPDRSADVVTTRSVLLYSDHRAAAFAEFFRVLRPGGRLSIFEPINRFKLLHRPRELFGIGPGSPVADLLARVYFDFDADDNTLVDFDERDLLTWAAEAGFRSIELDYRAQLDVPAEPITDWAALRKIAPNPLAPTYGEAIDAVLTEDERARLDAHMNALAAAGTPTRRTMAVAYLRAERPA